MSSRPLKRVKVRPEQKLGEKPKLDRWWRGLFLDTLAETSNVSESARNAGINPSRAYKVRRQNAEFRAEWHAALLEGYDHLELETLQRLRAGVGKDDNKFDLANALRLLSLHRATVAQERALRSIEEGENTLDRLGAKFDLMRERDASLKRLLAGDQQQDQADGEA